MEQTVQSDIKNASKSAVSSFMYVSQLWLGLFFFCHDDTATVQFDL